VRLPACTQTQVVRCCGRGGRRLCSVFQDAARKLGNSAVVVAVLILYWVHTSTSGGTSTQCIPSLDTDGLCLSVSATQAWQCLCDAGLAHKVLALTLALPQCPQPLQCCVHQQRRAMVCVTGGPSAGCPYAGSSALAAGTASAPRRAHWTSGRGGCGQHTCPPTVQSTYRTPLPASGRCCSRCPCVCGA